MKKKNKRSYFRKVEHKTYINRRNNLLKYIPKQPKLIKFLIDNETDEKYIKGLQTTTNWNRANRFKSVDSYDALCSSFSWCNTQEGYYYWSKLNDEFNRWMRGDQ